MFDWHVLYSKPRKERVLLDQLRQRSIDAYLPMAALRGRQTPCEPLFPRYLFARLTSADMSPGVTRWLPGLTSFVMFGGEYAMVPDTVIDYIRRRLTEMEQQAEAPFRRGQTVRIRGDHPLTQLDAVFDRPLSGGARARVLVEWLGRVTRCDVDMRDLEVVEDAGPGPLGGPAVWAH